MNKSSNLIILLLLIGTLTMAAQQNFSVLKSNTNRLFVDFEVKDNKNPDPIVLNSINLDNYEQFRNADKRVSATDIPTGYVLILYSQKEADINRAKKSPLQKVHGIQVNREKAYK